MDNETLKVLAQVAGIGGIALGVLLLVFREVIQKSIFSSLSPEESYRLLRLMIVLTFAAAIGGMGAWIYAKTSDPGGGATGSGPTKEFTLSGLVTDADNNALSGAEVFVVGAEDHVNTSRSGSFSLRTRAADNSVVNVRVSKDGYKARTENVKLPSSGLIVALTAQSGGAGVSSSAPPPAAGAGGPAVDPPAAVRPNATPSPPLGRINIRYAGDQYACGLGLTFTLGSKVVVPVGNLFPVSDVPLGDTAYQVSGTIACPGIGACTAGGAGRIMLRNESTYDVIWQNTSVAHCDVRLVALQ